MCRHCRNAVFGAAEQRQPPMALSNDMMIFYAPHEMYRHRMTVLEMISCIVCITSMICFSMEVKYGNMLDTEVHMQRHRVGARGNATSFQMPWQALLAEMQRLDEEQDAGRPPSLPHTGHDLAHVVQILFKTNDEDTRAGG